MKVSSPALPDKSDSLRAARLDKEYEGLLAVGGEGKRGIADAKEHFKNEEKEAKKKEEEIKVKIKTAVNTTVRSGRKGYIHFLAGLLIENLKEVSWPRGWRCRVAPTAEGVIFEIETADKRFFRSAFRPCGDGYYDLNAIKNFTERAWNLIDKQAKTAIWTPDNLKI